MDYRFPQANGSQSGRGEPSSSRGTASNNNMSLPNSRTSSKRSFDEYGHQSASGPSSSSSTTPTATSISIMGGAGAVLGLGASSTIGNHFADPVNNAHNARHKRRRASLSPPQPENSLHTPSMPVGASSTHTSPNASGHSASNSAESLMSWMEHDPSPQAALQHQQHRLHRSQLAAQIPESSSSALNETTHEPFFRNNSDSLYESRPDGEFRDNRMSWMPETTTTETVTTNTEPGWNFGPHDHHHNLGPPMDFSMPNAQSADAPNQPALHFLERNSYTNSNTENNMHVPSFRSDIRPATTSNFDSPHLISPRSPPVMDFWTNTSESRRIGLHRNSPSPTGFRPSFPQQPSSDPPSGETSSWWPFNRWNSYIDGATSPPPAPARTRPNAASRGQVASPTARPNLERQSSTTHRNRISPIDEPSLRPWSSEATAPQASPRTDMSRWPPYHFSSAESPTSQPTFSEPHVMNEPRRGNQNNRYAPPGLVDHSTESAVHRHLYGPGPSPTFGFFDRVSPSFDDSLTGFTTRPHDHHAFPVPNATPSIRPSANLYSSNSDRGVRFNDDSTRSRTSGRLPSPPPAARRTIIALHDILDRHTRNHHTGPDIDASGRASHRRSNSDASLVDPYRPRSPMVAPPRRVDRLEESREPMYLAPEETRVSDAFSWDRSTGPSSTPRTRNSRPEPRARPTSSFYDHPSMRDLVSNHSNHQEQERRELHSSLARAQPPPPPPSRRALSGLFDYTRVGNSGSSGGAPPEVPRASRAVPLRSNSPPLSSRPFSTLLSSRRPPSPASRPSPFRLDPSPLNDSTERPNEPRGSLRTRSQRRRESRMGRLLGVENPFAWLGSDEDFPFYESLNVEDTDLSGLSITAAERIRHLSRFRAGRQALRAMPMGRMRAVGDYVLDDDFDDSYEGLLALGQIVGPVKRGCSEDTLGGLPHGTYAEFSATGPESNAENKVLGDSGNCAICLEDYVATDMCTKLPRCLHFYHKDCVKEWLKTAKTCPVCRENVEGPPRVKGDSRPARVRFVPITEQRDNQNPQLQHLRNTSGPSSSSAAPVPAPRPSRRRSAAPSHPVPPPPHVYESDRQATTNTTLGRMRRLRMPTRIESSILGEFDDPWPAHPSPSPTDMFLHYRSSPSPPSFMLDMPSTSSRFGHGALTRALRDGHLDEMVPSSLHTYN